MSTSRGDIVTNTLRALRRTTSPDDRASVESYVNRFYADICKMVPIKSLRRRATVDLSDSAYSEGMWLPSNMAGVFRVKDVLDGFDYIERDRATVEDDNSSYRFYTYVPTSGPAFYGSDLELRKAGSTFTSTALTTDYTGSYVRFGNEPGLYLLSAIKTFTPIYYGPSLSQEEFEVRPASTEKLICIEPDEDAITDRSVYVDYWQLPTPLYRDFDVPLLPSTRALELMVMKEAMTIIGKRQLSANSYDRPIEAAMSELRKLCPSAAPVVRAKDIQGNPFSFSTNPFTERE